MVLGVLIRRFQILPDPQTNDETMAPVEHFFVVPKCVDPRTLCSNDSLTQVKGDAVPIANQAGDNLKIFASLRYDRDIAWISVVYKRISMFLLEAAGRRFAVHYGRACPAMSCCHC